MLVNTSRQGAEQSAPTYRRKGLEMTNREIRAVAWSMVLSPFVFALLSVLAYIQRGYFAVGGECVAFMLPLAIFFIGSVRNGGR